MPTPDAPLQLHSFLGGWGVASFSPFCLKTEAALRLLALPYDVLLPSGPPGGRTGKLPALSLADGRRIEGSDAILDHLRQAHGADLDAGLSPQQRALSLMARRTLEEHLYFAMLQERWVEDAGFAITQASYFASLPAILRAIVPRVIRGGVAKAARGQGLSRMDPTRMQIRVAEDLLALDTLLGDQDWFFGDGPSSLDAVAYGFIMNVVACPLEGRLKTSLARHPRLEAHAQRVHARCFGDSPVPEDP